MREIAASVIGGFLYGACFFGYMMLFSEEIICLGRRLAVRNRLSAAGKRYREVGALRSHLDKVLQAALWGRIDRVSFLWFCGLIFFGVCAVAVRSMTVFSAFITAFFTALLPYFALRVRVEIMRKKSSFEGEMFVSNLLNAYRMSNYSIFEAMEKAGREKQKTKNCSELISKILLEIRNTANHAEIGRAIDKFAYVINTNWSRMLAYNMGQSATRGVNISFALEDILIQLREAKAACEERKRINAETARIVKFFIPILYFISVFMSVKYVGIPVERFIYNQIFTFQGFTMLIAAIFLFVMNLALIEFINNQQFDY